MKTALIFSGGWDGHKPEEIATLLREALQPRGLNLNIQSSLSCLEDLASLQQHSVLIPNWTCGSLSPEQSANLLAAVRGGVGLAGMHGGMGDAFRGHTEYERMVGGHFVGHPHVGEYSVALTPNRHPITDGLPGEFGYRSEQYYLLVDPANEVLADSVYPFENRSCRMPVAWTKTWGSGRVFYSALGHDPVEFQEFPIALELTLRGILWAANLL